MDDALGGDDFHLTLYVCYELHYRGFDGVDERWEWHPGLLAFRASLERAFEARLAEVVRHRGTARAADMDLQLRTVIDAEDGPSLSRHLEFRGSREEFLEMVVHRSAYHLKEADPHSWALPRIDGRAKAALVEIQADEYGGGALPRMHSELFRSTMEELDLDGGYGAYLDHLPGCTLATVNLMSLFGLHRRLRGAIVGHLAVFEMTSAVASRRYANGLRRLGFGPRATDFYLEHVEADSVHESVAANDLAGGLAAESPRLAADVLFGAEAALIMDRLWAEHVTACWERGATSLRLPLATPTPA